MERQLLVLIIPVAIILWLLGLWVIAKLGRRPANWYLDWTTKPREKYHPDMVVKPEQGVILELVTRRLREAVMPWMMLYLSVRMLAVGLFLGMGLNLLYLYYLVFSTDLGLGFSADNLYILVGSVLFALSLMPALYWVWDWKLKYIKLVVFTDVIYFLEAKIVWLAVFFPLYKADDPKWEKQPIYMVREVRFQPDPEGLGGEQTPVLRDLITKSLSKKYSLGSLLIFSEQIGAATLWPWQAYAAGLDTVLRMIKKEAVSLEADRNAFHAESRKIEAGFGQQNWDRATARGEAKKTLSRFDVLHPLKGDPVFIFDAEDPGLWDLKSSGPTPKRNALFEQSGNENSASSANPQQGGTGTNPQPGESGRRLWDMLEPEEEEFSSAEVAEPIVSTIAPPLNPEETFQPIWRDFKAKSTLYGAGFNYLDALDLYVKYGARPEDLLAKIKTMKTKQQIVADLEGGM